MIDKVNNRRSQENRLIKRSHSSHSLVIIGYHVRAKLAIPTALAMHYKVTRQSYPTCTGILASSIYIHSGGEARIDCICTFSLTNGKEWAKPPFIGTFLETLTILVVMSIGRVREIGKKCNGVGIHSPTL
jgi:hypothetical protein